MVTPIRHIETDGIYHVFNRGVEKRTTFVDWRDYHRFLTSLAFYQQVQPRGPFSLSGFSLVDRVEPLRFDILAYCLMPNHFHLLVRQRVDDGVRDGVGQLLTSYTKYFNARYDRVGPLFQGRFRSKPIVGDELLVHSARYVMLNAIVAGLTDSIDYRWSSYADYQRDHPLLCETETILGYFKDGRVGFNAFMADQVDYARSLERAKHALFV